MIDTDIRSDLMRPAPEPAVVAAQPDASVFIIAITKAELGYGAALLQSGNSRAMVAAEIDGMLGPNFGGRIAPFDNVAPQAVAVFEAERGHLGKRFLQVVGKIAAVARSHGARLATSNVSTFEDCGSSLINARASGGG